MRLDSRKEDILGFIVRDYVRTALPVSSGRISAHKAIDASPATIRNIMLDLDGEDYLYQPHTSAGRAPTEKGYNYFIRHLMSTRVPEAEIRERLDNIIETLDQEADLAFDQLSRAMAGHLKLFSGIGFLDAKEKFFGKGLPEVFRAPEFAERNLASEFADFAEGISKNLADFGRCSKEDLEPVFNIQAFGVVSIFFDDENFGRCAIFSAGPKRMNYEKAAPVLKYAAKDISAKGGPASGGKNKRK